jgi:hypothetical protein
MAVTVDGVLREWGESLFYRLPKKGQRCKTITGTHIELSRPNVSALRSPRVMKASIRAAARKAPEVMVKISGSAKGMRQARAHFDYITRDGQLSLENESGELIEGKAALQDLTNEWRYGLFGMPEVGRRRETLNIVLSMPAGTDREAVRNAAADFGRRQFGKERPYVFVAHEDEPHPHVHLCVKVLGPEGTRLNPRKADLQLWREQFAESLREHGISASATPRRARGTRQRTITQVAHHRGNAKLRESSSLSSYPSERAQVAAFGAIAKHLVAVGGEGTELAIDITKIVRGMAGRPGILRRTERQERADREVTPPPNHKNKGRDR